MVINPSKILLSSWTLFAVVLAAGLVFFNGLNVGLLGMVWLVILGIVIVCFFIGSCLEAKGGQPTPFFAAIAFGFCLSFLSTAFTGEWLWVFESQVLIDPETKTVRVVDENGFVHRPEHIQKFDIENVIDANYSVENDDGSKTQYEMQTDMKWLDHDFIIDNASQFSNYNIVESVKRTLIVLHYNDKLSTKRAALVLCEVLAKKGFETGKCAVNFSPIQIETRTTYRDIRY